jgi:hypothetical protein
MVILGVKISNSADKEYKKFKWTLSNNVDINCVGSSMSAELIWCYNANCSRAIGNCSQSGLTHSSDICSEKEEGALVLKFRPLTAEMGRKWYFCQQRVPLIENSSASIFLKTPRAGIIIPGEKNKLVELGQRGVSFGCKSHTHNVTWCYDSSCVKQIILCPPNQCSNVQQICHCHDNDGSIMLNFPEITVEMLGSYYCIGEAASDTVRPVQLIMETPSSPLVQESVTKSTHAPSSYQVMIPSPTSSPSLQSKPPSQSLSTSSHSSSHLFMSPTTSSMSTQLISAQSITDIPDVEPRYIQSENQVNTTAAISIVSGAIVGLLVVLLAVTCRSKLWARRWSLLHFGELSSKDEKEWDIRRSKLRIGRCLGDGYFGSVFKAEVVGKIKGWAETDVAVKMVNNRRSVDGAISLSDEIKLLKTIERHENIIALIGTCVRNGPLWMVMEYAEDGNLLCYLRLLRPTGMLDSHILKSSDTKQILSEKTMWNFALQIVQGMKHLMAHKCIHRDLAARNVLVCKGQRLKVCDFGMARDIHYMDYYRRISPGVLPLKWTAPEAAVDKIFTEYSDVWSFGIVLWEISTLG